MKLDVAEPLSSTRDGQFVLGSPVGVVERRPRGTPFGNASQVLDGQRGAQAALEVSNCGLLNWSRVPDRALWALAG